MENEKKTHILVTFANMFFGNIYIGFSVFIFVFGIVGFFQNLLYEHSNSYFLLSIKPYINPSKSTYAYLLILFLYLLRIPKKILETKVNIKKANKISELKGTSKNKKTDSIIEEVALNSAEAIKFMNFNEFYYEHLGMLEDEDISTVKIVFFQYKISYLKYRVLGHILSFLIFMITFFIIDFNSFFSMPNVLNTLFVTVFLFQLINIIIYGLKFLINSFYYSIPDSKDRMTVIIAFFGTIISLIALFK